MLVPMKDLLIKAKNEHYAVPHFNVWNVEMLEGVMDAAELARSPVIISFGSGFLNNTDIDHYASMMVSYAESSTVPTSVHWDHGRNIDIVLHAADLGFNSVMIDASANPLEMNIKLTKQVVDTFHPRNIPVEGELGHVGAETIYEEAIANYRYTRPDEAKIFVEETGIDALAVAIGNKHGPYSSTPQINFAILEEVNQVVDIPLVLHGGSGISDDDFRKAISLGITKINIHTELCQAAMDAIEKSHLKEHTFSSLQLKVRKEIAKRAYEKIIIFGSLGKGG